MLFPQNPITFQAEQAIKQLLAPLTEIGDLCYFSYGVNYPDTSCFTLASHPEYYEACLDKEFPLWGFFLKSGWHLWGSTLPQEQLAISREMDIGKGIIHVNHQEDKTVIVEFATRPDNKKAYDFYLNNEALLKKFIHYFTKKASFLIDRAQQQLMRPLPHMALTSQANTLLNGKKKNSPTFIFENNSPFSLLSKREHQCCCLLLQGYSIAEIGQELDLAIPTIANYIARIKYKLGCKNRREMGRLAQEFGLLDYSYLYPT